MGNNARPLAELKNSINVTPLIKPKRLQKLNAYSIEALKNQD
jgi:hypothetical protein